MKKLTILIALFSVTVAAVVYVLFQPGPKTATSTQQPKIQPIVAGTNNAFQQAMAANLDGYYQLKDALVQSNVKAASTAATSLLPILNTLDISTIQADSVLLQMAAELKQTITTQCSAVAAAPNLDQQRQQFQTLSDAFFDLLRATKYKGSKVYQQYCPMAFNNSGAAWLSNSPDVVNPYFGEAMLNCGEVRDSLRQ
ncbi:MAG: DUF3347 domain-containing protein [Bacteroidetes bacterium]|nr:MAG: DUF3347 domain-containing protein [Bacteroidota bacterium]